MIKRAYANFLILDILWKESKMKSVSNRDYDGFQMIIYEQ